MLVKFHHDPKLCALSYIKLSRPAPCKGVHHNYSNNQNIIDSHPFKWIIRTTCLTASELYMVLDIKIALTSAPPI